jgi:hypothetical protein
MATEALPDLLACVAAFGRSSGLRPYCRDLRSADERVRVKCASAEEDKR